MNVSRKVSSLIDFILLPAVQTCRRNEECLAGHRNTAGWKDVKEEITDTAGNSHQCVLRLPNCAADVLRWGNPSLLEQQREASLFLSISTVLHPPPARPRFLPTVSLRSGCPQPVLFHWPVEPILRLESSAMHHSTAPVSSLYPVSMNVPWLTTKLNQN